MSDVFSFADQDAPRLEARYFDEVLTILCHEISDADEATRGRVLARGIETFGRIRGARVGRSDVEAWFEAVSILRGRLSRRIDSILAERARLLADALDEASADAHARAAEASRSSMGRLDDLVSGIRAGIEDVAPFRIAAVAA